MGRCRSIFDSGPSDTVGHRRNGALDGPALPALVEDLERVRLDIQLAAWNHKAEQLRQSILTEEAAQHRLETEIEVYLGRVRDQVMTLLGEIERLEARLRRLETATYPLSDDELDDQEYDERAESAAFWAEWRQQRSERSHANGRGRPNGNPRQRDRELRDLYRTLARLIHPDLATDSESREHRENVMRLANMAFESGNVSQLERLLALWSDATPDDEDSSLDAARERLTQRKSECDTLRKQLKALERSEIGRLLRTEPRRRQRDLDREYTRLRRELAGLRLRRRRLLRGLDSRRDQMTEVSD